MVMQNKLIINYTFRKSIKEINIREIKENVVLFEFNEYEPILISLNAPDYRINMECYSYYTGEDYKQCDNNELIINNNETYKISDNNNVYDIGYIPSKYSITIINIATNKKIECYFIVKSNRQMTENGMDNMIEHINNFIDGLSIDFFREHHVNNICSEKNNSNYYLYELINRYSAIIAYKSERVIQNLSHSIISVVEISHLEKKQNIKTIRKNILNLDQNKYYNIKKKKSVSTIDNMILKKYLIKIKQILENGYIDLDTVVNINSEKLNQYYKEKNNIDLKIRERNISISDKKDFLNNKKSLEIEIKNITELIKKVNVWKNSYNNTLMSISRILELDEIFKLKIDNNITYSISFYKNNDYKFFYDLYNKISQNNTSKHKIDSKSLFTDKRSYTLFEIYGFILIQNILKELNLSMIYGTNDLFSFRSDCEYWYSNNNYQVRLQYDHYCKKYRNTDEVKLGDIVNKNSISCKPDYIISIFDKNKILKNAIVVEMKYRKLKYLTNYDKGSTETDSTIDDYSQLCGIVNDIKKPKNIISEVIILYPSLEEKIFERNSGLYIGINSESNFFDSSGYKKLKLEIENSMNI